MPSAHEGWQGEMHCTRVSDARVDSSLIDGATNDFFTKMSSGWGNDPPIQEDRGVGLCCKPQLTESRG